MNALTEILALSKTHRMRTFAMLVLAFAFVFSQSVAPQHVHVDGELSASCAACQHTDDSPTLVSTVAAKVTSSLSVSYPSIFASLFASVPLQHDHLSRAPPLTK